MTKVNGNELNSDFLKKIDAKINELYSDEGTVMAADLSEFLVNDEKKYILKGNQFFYNQLKELKRILSFSETEELDVFSFKNVAFKKSDEKKFKDIINSSRFLRDEFVRELLEFNSVGFLPGYNGRVYAPLPRLNGQSIADYEHYLKDYYASYNISVGMDEETGVRKPYPHELCQWENGVPRQGEKNFRNAYYRDLVAKFGNKDLSDDEEKNINISNDSKIENSAPSAKKGTAKKIKFRVKEKKSYESIARRASNAVLEAPDKLRNLDQKLGSDEFWHGASKIVKRSALIALGGILGGGLIIGLGAQFIGSFSTPGWVALGTGTGTSLSALIGPLIGQIALTVAPIIGVTTLILLYGMLRKKHLKKKEAMRKLEEKPSLGDALEEISKGKEQEYSKEEKNDLYTQNIKPEPSLVGDEIKPKEEAIIKEIQNDNFNVGQDSFLQLNGLIDMVKKNRDLINELEARKITVEGNGSPEANSILNDINEKTNMINSQIKDNLKNIADLCMSYNHQYDEANNLSEGGMKL